MIRSSNLLARRLLRSSLTKNAPSAIPSATFSLMTNSSVPFRPVCPSSLRSAAFSSASRKLVSILRREINEETEASSEYSGALPPELSQLHKEICKEWTIIEGIGSGETTGSGASVRMLKKKGASNGASIGLVFHCQDTEPHEPFDEQFEGREDDDEEEEPAQAVRFGVTVSNGGKTAVLQCQSAGENSLIVEGVTVREGDMDTVLLALAGGEGTHASLYQGPEFTELAEDLQEAFHTFVIKECGVDNDVTSFIGMYSDYREQEEYINWMKTTVAIIAD